MNSTINRVFSSLVFPLMIIGGVGSFFMMLAAGLAPLPASVIPVVISALIIRLLERKLPFRDEWSASARELKTDFSYILLVQGLLAQTLALMSILKSKKLRAAP